MPKGMPNPVAVRPLVREHSSNLYVCFLTHVEPVSQPEKSCLRVERQIGIRTFGIVVRAEGVRSTFGGGEAAASDEPGGHSGANEGLSVHLTDALDRRMASSAAAYLESSLSMVSIAVVM